MSSSNLDVVVMIFWRCRHPDFLILDSHRRVIGLYFQQLFVHNEWKFGQPEICYTPSSSFVYNCHGQFTAGYSYFEMCNYENEMILESVWKADVHCLTVSGIWYVRTPYYSLLSVLTLLYTTYCTSLFV